MVNFYGVNDSHVLHDPPYRIVYIWPMKDMGPCAQLCRITLSCMVSSLWSLRQILWSLRTWRWRNVREKSATVTHVAPLKDQNKSTFLPITPVFFVRSSWNFHDRFYLIYCDEFDIFKAKIRWNITILRQFVSDCYPNSPSKNGGSTYCLKT